MTLPHESDPQETTSSSAASVAPEPILIDINEFRLKSLSELQDLAEGVAAKIQGGIPKSQLIYELLCFYGREGARMVCEGILEQSKENFAMLRDAQRSFRPGPDDIHLSANVMRDHGLRVGQLVKVSVRAPWERDKYL
jgi:transcription termination factor Rho